MELIELAPQHKIGLPISSPILPAAGIFGYGEAYRDLIAYELLGAIVTNPVSLYPRKAAHGRRIAAHGDSLIIHTGLPNPGLRSVIRQHGPFWERQALPVIVHLIATTPAEVSEACRILSTTPKVAGIELGLDEGTSVEAATALLRAARATSELPVIARLPFAEMSTLIQPMVEGGTDALTLSAPPRAALPNPDNPESEHFNGRLYSPAIFPLLFYQLRAWVPRVHIPVIACGGISTLEEIQAYLQIGIKAVQLDTLIWRDPTTVTEIARNVTEDKKKR